MEAAANEIVSGIYKGACLLDDLTAQSQDDVRAVAEAALIAALAVSKGA